MKTFSLEYLRWLLLYSAGTLSILAMRIIILILEGYVAAAYYLLNTISFWLGTLP